VKSDERGPDTHERRRLSVESNRSRSNTSADDSEFDDATRLGISG